MTDVYVGTWKEAGYTDRDLWMTEEGLLYWLRDTKLIAKFNVTEVAAIDRWLAFFVWDNKWTNT